MRCVKYPVLIAECKIITKDHLQNAKKRVFCCKLQNIQRME